MTGEKFSRPGSHKPHVMNALEPCGIRVDENGDWFYHGNRIFRPEVLEALYEELDRLPTGEFVLAGRWLLDVDDTPFVVSRVDLERDRSGGERIMIRFKNISRVEALDPETLAVGNGNILYCRVFHGRFLARYSRPAYYQLAQFVIEDDTGRGFYIELNGSRYPVGQRDEDDR